MITFTDLHNSHVIKEGCIGVNMADFSLLLTMIISR